MAASCSDETAASTALTTRFTRNATDQTCCCTRYPNCRPRRCTGGLGGKRRRQENKRRRDVKEVPKQTSGRIGFLSSSSRPLQSLLRGLRTGDNKAPLHPLQSIMILLLLRSPTSPLLYVALNHCAHSVSTSITCFSCNILNNVLLRGTHKGRTVFD